MIDRFRLFEAVQVVQHLPPVSRTANTYAGTAIDVSDCDAIGVIIHVGDIAATGTFDASVQHSDVSGSGYANISGTAITQLGASDDNKDVTIDVLLHGEATRKKFVQVSCTNANAAVLFGVTVIKYRCRQIPIVNAPVTKFA